MFNGRRLLIATKHQKESVLAPIMEKELEVDCFTCPEFDSDILGTFTGEVDRSDDALTTIKNKCYLAMSLAQCDLAIASEGSFGLHPSIFFAHADEEFLIFIDSKNQLEIMVRELSLKTNFSGEEVGSENELKNFAVSVGFPSHGLIIRKKNNDVKHIAKGISDWKTLLSTYHELKSGNGKVYVETDMRAMYNPSRMQVIETAAQKLAAKIKSKCPECQMPGFGAVEAKSGLRCELCGSPTRSILSHIYCCNHCSFSKEIKYPNGKIVEVPMYCDLCNP